MKKDLFKIGIVVKSQGLKGQVKIVLDSMVEIHEPLNLDLLFYEQKENFYPLQVESFEWRNSLLIVKFKGWNSINDVEFLKNLNILVNKENSSFQLKKNWKDYMVMSNLGESKVIDVMSNGAQDLIKIKIKKNTFWVPLVEVYLEKVDDEQKVIYLKDLEGLM